jgi:hypothetical protein
VPNVLRRAVVAAAAVTALGVAVSVPASAHASTSEPTPSMAAYSYNWSGYNAIVNSTILGVQAQFNVPKNISCKNSLGSKGPYYAAMWDGIGGDDNGLTHNYWLEQDGVTAKCATKTAKPTFTAWWAFVMPGGTTPAEKGAAEGFGSDANVVPTVSAGNEIFAQVLTPKGDTIHPGEWQFEVSDLTTNKTWVIYVELPSAAATDTGKTAEVITEDPQTLSGNAEPFVDLGPVSYTSASYIASDNGGKTYQILPVTQHRMDLYRSGIVSFLNLMVYPTQPTGNGYDFSTEYTSYWNRP